MRYELVPGGYLLVEDGCVHPPLPAIAIGYMSPAEGDKLCWRSQRIGEPKKVQAWAENARRVLSRTGPVGKAMAEEIHVIEGQLDVADLNAVLQDPTAIRALVRKVSTAKVMNHAAIDGTPIQPGDSNA